MGVRSVPPAQADGESRDKRDRRDLISITWRHLRGERRLLVGLAALAALAAQAESAALILISLMAEAAAKTSSRLSSDIGPLSLEVPIPVALALTAAAILAAAILVFTASRLAVRAGARIERESRDQIVSSYAALDWEHQAGQRSSYVQGRLLSLMEARASAFDGLFAWIRAWTMVAVFITVAAVVSPLAALIIALFGGGFSLAVLPLRRRIAKLSGQLVHGRIRIATDVAEAADQGADIHVFGAWRTLHERFVTRSTSMEDLTVRQGVIRQLMPVAYQYGALTMILIVTVVILTSGSADQLGAVAAAALLLLRSVQYGQQVQRSLQELAVAVPKIDLFNASLVVPPPRRVPGDNELTAISHVELRQVEYRYPESEEPAISDISFCMRPGTIVGIAGPSGSGKSTLAQILLRLRWPTSGAYIVNDLDSAKYSAESWRRVITHVPQQPRLLHGSLFDNVSYLDASVPADRVSLALHAVGLTELVDSLPDGLDTDLGPTGHSLSGGQVQRLGIARALVRDPRLVVLDEPTSALDVDSERLVADALGALRGKSDVIVVVIAHRPSTLALCDEIAVLDSGRLVAMGRPEDVTARNTFMARTLLPQP